MRRFLGTQSEVSHRTGDDRALMCTHSGPQDARAGDDGTWVGGHVPELLVLLVDAGSLAASFGGWMLMKVRGDILDAMGNILW